jgi:hypothetical protein
MEPEERINPYSNYGGVAFGTRFIGRKKELKFFTERIINSPNPQDISIVGAPKIGKSSLVREALMEKKSELIAKKKIPIWINMGTFDTPENFFSGIVFKTYSELEGLSLINKEINNNFSKITHENVSLVERSHYIEKFFETIKRMDFDVVFIFDEFDHARKLFKGNLSGFQTLRELTYNPDLKTCQITISRRSLREIELQSGSISNYYSLFHERSLLSYDSDDLVEYFGKMKNVGLQLNDDQHKTIKYHCGSHPYLLDIACYNIMEEFFENSLQPIETTISSNGNLFQNYYDDIVVHLNENASFEKVLQVLFGPLISVHKRDILTLQRCGFLSPGSDETLISISQDFSDFLYFLQRKIELWPILSQVERGLRELITKKMNEKYSEHWIERLENDHPKLKPTFDESRKNQQKEMNYFGKASDNLLDYTYIGTLFSIIIYEWGTFQSVLEKNEDYWDQHKTAIVKIRNPLAHFRDEIPSESHKKIAEGYCEEILEILRHEK